MKRDSDSAELERLIQGVADPVVREYLLMADDSIVIVLPFALAIAARLSLADACGDSGRTLPELAGAVRLPPEPLSGLLKALASVGFFTEDEHGRFRPTALGEMLRANSPVSMLATLANTDSHWAWLRAVDAAAQGRPIVNSAFAEGYFAHKEHAPAAATFNRRMRERASRLYLGLADVPIWAKARWVLDIGGGIGAPLAAVMHAWPHLRGTLFDRALVIDAAVEGGELDAVRERVTFVAGDFFKELPPGADVHLLCSILHNWSDPDAVDILQASSKALPPGGRVLVCEMILPDSPEPHPARWSDLGMMVMLGGRERTLPEFTALLNCAGLTAASVVPIRDSAFSVIEARVASNGVR